MSNKIEFLKERIATYTDCIARAEKTQANLHVYLESGSMKKPEFNARIKHSQETIEMYKEKLARRQKELTEATAPPVFCSKCGKVAMKAEQVRDEDGILISVKYIHEMIPASGYVWTCTQVMDYPAIYNHKGSIKKEMEKRPYAFKQRQKGGFSNLDRITPDHYIKRDAKQYSSLNGEKVNI
ncbi:hypothetical protein HWB81_gp15 [Bacillus phage Wes44]|uniref:Uncharacterized protein n=1 Tax=Bacillus phage Wes44 TaxID=2283012 RepID=A0A346FK19_9CAUD|nr:hypothetical protein HWB81_gp15 [Bacillus phage Wes44]AXN58324.1 hypothetical protein Wes44_15 [Bacillus phage Wes44]